MGVYLDSLLDMHVHISKTVKACHFQLRRLRRVLRLLGRNVTANLVTALILTKLDYGNALLAGLPHTSVAPYQRVINAADSCLAYGTATTSPRRRSSSTGYLPKLAFSTNCVSTPCSRRESTRVHHRPPSTRRRCHITTNCSSVGNEKHSVHSTHQTTVQRTSIPRRRSQGVEPTP